MFYIILFIFGAIAGSFLNVVALRWDVGNFGGRSKCPNCSKTLEWYELIPILSFILQRGKCKGCRGNISFQYPLVEAATGLAFATVFNSSLPLFHNILLLAVFCFYIVILIYDFRYKIIPNALVYPSIILSLVFRALSGGTFLDWLAGPLIFLFFGSIWYFSQGRAMGFGDAKLGLSVGLLLGAAQGFSAIVLSFWFGAAYSLSYILLHKFGFVTKGKRLTMKSEIPFAPFIILGAWVGLVLSLNILNVP